MYNPNFNAKHFNDISQGYFPALLGIEVTHVEEGRVIAEMEVRKEFFAPNGFLHAGSIVTFADTLAGHSTIAHLPENGKSFTTLELKSNFIRAIREGKLRGESTAEHIGRTTQVWRVMLSDAASAKTVAVFSCTQLILY
ncbi:MAG: PaaI family thioesterase [Bacteroidia bacterium]|nr:PaaI family thioesterase [Bacteroidia bacterium]